MNDEKKKNLDDGNARVKDLHEKLVESQNETKNVKQTLKETEEEKTNVINQKDLKI